MKLFNLLFKEDTNEPARLYPVSDESSWEEQLITYGAELYVLALGVAILVFLFLAINCVGATESGLVYNHLLNGGI